jgi:pimeloyl-[acyl-carrier protein] methyl ester esterase
MSLHVESSGSGRDLFLIHGWGMHGGVWDGVTEALAQQFRIHAVDLPGMGESPACDPYTSHRLVELLAERLTPHAIVCGWSFGGQLAMRLALDYPEKVGHLVLVGSTPRFVNGQDWFCGMEATVFEQFAAQVANDYQATMKQFLGLQAFGGESPRELIRTLRERFALRPQPDRQALKHVLQMLLTNDLRGEMTQISRPVLLLHGDRDKLAPVAAAHWMAGAIPDARLRVITGATHAPFLSHPAAFLREMADFLE